MFYDITETEWKDSFNDKVQFSNIPSWLFIEEIISLRSQCTMRYACNDNLQ